MKLSLVFTDLHQQLLGRNNSQAKLYKLPINLNYIMLPQGLDQNKALIIGKKSGELAMQTTTFNAKELSYILGPRLTHSQLESTLDELDL